MVARVSDDARPDAGAGQGLAAAPGKTRAQAPPNGKRNLRVLTPKQVPEGGTGPAPDDDASLRTRIGAVASRTRVRRRFLVDVGMLGLGVAAAGLYDGNVTRGGFPWAVLFVVLTFMNLKVRGLYDQRLRTNPLEDFSQIVSATSLAAILVVGARVAAGAVDGASLQGVRLWAWSTILLTAGRIGIAVVVRRRQRAGHGQMVTLIVGADAIGRQIARRLAEQPELGLRPIGFIDEQLAPLEGRDDIEFPVLGTTADVEAIVRRHDVRHLIVGYAAARPQLLTAAVRKCRRMGLQVSTVPRLYEDVNHRVDVEHIGGIPLLSSRPADPQSWQFSLKYGLDRLIAALALILLAPAMAAIAIAVRLSSAGSILYRQPRVSLDGREFSMLKFRTMHGDEVRDGHQDAEWASQTVDADHEPPPAAESDRRTRVGAILRRCSLDELPQLFNVLFGDMSLVGPRPERTSYVQLFSEHVYRYGDRHRVKSGLTGWAQVNGLRGETSLADRVEWDNYYIENWSLWLDFKILFLTTPALFRRRGD
jgi:exopolysaccharide biosynthesis polyprenyl glycosylphosphotransferase